MKDSFRRIRLLIRKREAFIVLCALLCLPCLAHSQNGEFLPSQTKTKTGPSKMQSTVSPRVLAQAVEPKIPVLVGHTLLEVGSLVGNQFTVAIENRRSSTGSQDRILRQFPPAGTTAKRGAEIQVWVSEPTSTPPPPPPPLVKVPNLVGNRRDSAIQMLSNAYLRQGVISPRDSEEDDGIVLSQDPGPSMVARDSAVNFEVSRHIQRTLTLKGPSSAKPGESLTFVAHLDPYFPSTQYQFTFGEGQPSPWDANPVGTHTFASDGNYEVTAFATWDGGKASSDPVQVAVHSVPYVLTLTPSPTQQIEGNTIEFRAELDPAIENAGYTFDFGDRTEAKSSSLPIVPHVYARGGAYTASVSVLIPGHKHRIPSLPTRVVIVSRRPSPIVAWLNRLGPWIIGGVILVVGGFLLGTLRARPPKTNRNPPNSKIELKPSIPPGELTIRVKGRLWSRIESLRAKDRRDHSS